MKKIISSILITVSIIALHSCRNSDDENIKDIQNRVDKEPEIYKRTVSDTLLQPTKSIHRTDPPPKDGGQWKMRK